MHCCRRLTSVLLLKQRDQAKQQPQQSGQQLRVSIAKLSSLEPGNKRLDLCGVSGILIWIFLHQRRRRFYAARRLEARASRTFLPFSRSVSASARLARHFSRLIVSFRENKVEPK